MLARTQFLDGLLLLRAGAWIDVNPRGAAPLVDCFRPPETEGELHAIKLRAVDRALRDFVCEEGLAMPLRRVPVEVARAAVITIAALDILRRKTPFIGHFQPPRRIARLVLERSARAHPPHGARSNTV